MIKPDQFFRNSQKPYVDMETNEGGKKRRGGVSPFKVLGTIFVLIVLSVTAFNGFYLLPEDQNAVLTTFGQPSTVTASGLHFKIPFVQRVHFMTKGIMGMAIGYAPDNDNQNPAYVPTESEMITKDFNFVNVDFYIEYQIVDPVKAYVNMETSTEILQNLAQSYIRDTVGIYDVDEVITTGKAEIQAKVKTLLSERLEQEDIGLGIYNVTIQDAEPPTVEVSNAFKSVEDAKQGMDTAINEARKYQSEQIPAANAKADKKRQDAEAYKQQRVSEAEGQVARFNDMYNEYIKYPLITKKRMFYETMEDVLPSLKVIIDGSNGTQTILPLDSFTKETPSGAGMSGSQTSGMTAPAAAQTQKAQSSQGDASAAENQMNPGDEEGGEDQ